MATPATGKEVNQVSERDVEQYLKKQIKIRGGRSWKWTSPGVRGVPDQILTLPNGLVVFVEVKDDTGKLRPDQQRVLDVLDALNQDTYVVYGKEGVDDLISDLEAWGMFDDGTR